MAAEPEIAELSRRLREVPPDAADAVYDRIRLGELIAQAMERRREHDGQVLLDGDAPAAEAFARKTPARRRTSWTPRSWSPPTAATGSSRPWKLGRAHADRFASGSSGRSRPTTSSRVVRTMGLFTGLVTLPLAPVKGVVWPAETLTEQAEARLYDPGRIAAEMQEIADDAAAGEITEGRPRPARRS